MWGGNYVIAPSRCRHESAILDFSITSKKKKIDQQNLSKSIQKGKDLEMTLNWKVTAKRLILKIRKACPSKYGCHGGDKVGEHEALTSKYSFG